MAGSHLTSARFRAEMSKGAVQENQGTSLFPITAVSRVRRFDLQGNFLGDAAMLRNSNGPITDQTGIDTDGQFFYTSTFGDARVRKFSFDGNFLGDFVQLSDQGGAFGNNTGIAILSGLHLSIRVTQVELCWNSGHQQGISSAISFNINQQCLGQLGVCCSGDDSFNLHLGPRFSGPTAKSTIA